MQVQLTDCRFPDLDAPYDAALRAAVTLILERTDPLGIVASGTIIRGQHGPNSDLDICVIHAEPWRQRLQRRFHGVPAEIFVNPPSAVPRYFEDEKRARRPITAHMLATGFVILDRDPVMDRLRTQAREFLANPSVATPDEQRWMRYMTASLYEDAVDAAADPDTVRLILPPAVREMLHFRFVQADRWLPRDKDLFATLDVLDPDLAALARTFFAAADPATQLDLAGQIADHTLGERGFFEWDSDPEVFPDG